MGSGGRRRRGRAAAVLLAAVAVAGGCELTEVTVAEPDDVVVAEVQLVLVLDPGGFLNPPGEGGISLRAVAFLHRTLGSGVAAPVGGAAVRVSGASGAEVQLEATDSAVACFGARARWIDEPAESERPWPSLDEYGSCYRKDLPKSPFAPGELVELEVILPDGRTLTGSSRIPGTFDFRGLAQADGRCRVAPETNYRFEWTEAEGTWAYVSDTRIEGLPEALAGRDVEAPDTLFLVGFSIGREDTDVVFPSEYGLFDIGDGISAELLRILNDGLPAGTTAEVAIGAADRNWINWGRGGNFNPSGLVRIASVFGAGTGTFGTATQRVVTVVAAPDGDGAPPLCGPAATPEP